MSDITQIILALIALVGSPLGIWLTHRINRQKIDAEVQQLKAHAEETRAEVRSHQIDNDRKAIEMIMELVVEPLRRDMEALQHKVETLTNAIEKIHECHYADDCPVARELRHATHYHEQRGANNESWRRAGRSTAHTTDNG